MQKTKKIVVANWKMNPQTAEAARAIFLGIRRVAEKLKRTEVVVCPPFVYIHALSKLVSSPKIKIGGQDVFWETSGSFTGEISSSMLSSAEVGYVIVGHSERRAIGETNEMVSKKVLAALREGLKVILCIGEKTRDNQGDYLAFLKDQMLASLSGVQKRHLLDLIVAYEPVWAIGKSEQDALSGSGMHEMVIFIRKILSDVYGRDFAAGVPVLYGGSVAPSNTENIVREGMVDGLLVGRQSLEPKSFSEILNIVDLVSQ